MSVPPDDGIAAPLVAKLAGVEVASDVVADAHRRADGERGGEAGLGPCGLSGLRRVEREEDLRRSERREPALQGRAAFGGRDDPLLADLGDGVVVGHEQREIGDVAIGAVRVGRPHRDLLGRVHTLEHGGLGEHLDARDLGDAGGVVLGPARDPLQDGAVVGGVRLV